MKPLPRISAKIVDEEGNELVPGPDDGEHVTGYLGRSGIGIGRTPVSPTPRTFAVQTSSRSTFTTCIWLPCSHIGLVGSLLACAENQPRMSTMLLTLGVAPSIVSL
jgi:hypothetical protein